MTFNIGTIQGGTRAGWRKVKQKPKMWRCECPPAGESRLNGAPIYVLKRGYLVECPDCGAKRDDHS